MWKRLLHFVQYNNAFVFVVAIAFAGATGVFAASPEARDSVYSSEQKVLSIDNTYLLNTVLDTYQFNAHVIEVTEDEESYYVAYGYKTIEVVDYVWRDVDKTGQMTFSKKELYGKDLGLAVAEELAEIVHARQTELLATQEVERKLGVSQKVVSTEYSGLVGRFLSTDEEVFPGYTPVVDESRFIAADDLGNVAAQVSGALGNGGKVPGNLDPFQKNIATADDPLPGYPVITLLGNNPATVEVRSSYADLGGSVDDDKDKDLMLSVAGESIDTAKPGSHRINYSVTDGDGNTTTAYRIVNVIDPFSIAPVPPQSPAPSNDVVTPAPVEQKPETMPVPEPESAPSTLPEPKKEPEPAPEPVTPPSPEPESASSTPLAPEPTPEPEPVVQPEPDEPEPTPDPVPATETASSSESQTE